MMTRMKRRLRSMRSWFRRKPLVWIFSAVSQLKIPPVGRIITIVWSPHNPATIRPREWGVMAIVWQRGWHTGWTTAPGPSAPTTPGLQAYSYPTSSSCTTTTRHHLTHHRCTWCIQNASGASSTPRSPGTGGGLLC